MNSDELALLLVDREEQVARVIVKVDAVDMAVVEPLGTLLREAAEAGVRRLEIDLSGVAFADSTVVKLATQARDWVAPRGAQVAIKAPPVVRRVLDLTGTTHLFDIIESA